MNLVEEQCGLCRKIAERLGGLRMIALFDDYFPLLGALWAICAVFGIFFYFMFQSGARISLKPLRVFVVLPKGVFRKYLEKQFDKGRKNHQERAEGLAQDPETRLLCGAKSFRRQVTIGCASILISLFLMWFVV